MEYITDLSIIPVHLRPPYYYSSNGSLKHTFIGDEIDKEKQKWINYINEQQQSDSFSSNCVSDCWERLARIIELKPEDSVNF